MKQTLKDGIGTIGAAPVNRTYLEATVADAAKLHKELKLKPDDAVKLLEVAERRRFNDLLESIALPIAEAFKADAEQ